ARHGVDRDTEGVVAGAETMDGHAGSVSARSPPAGQARRDRTARPGPGTRPSPGRAGSALGGSGAVVAVDQADGVDAVALVGGGVEALPLEDVAQVRAAAGAAHLDAPHPHRRVLEQ